MRFSKTGVSYAMTSRVFTLVFTAGLVLISATASAAPTAKNVLLIVSDDLKASVLGCYGNPICATPNIDKLAASGTVFDRAYCQGTVCGPSRRSFMRSRYQDKQGITLGEDLISKGYYSARVGKIFHMRVPGDIIAGTNGEDVATCWTERFNAQGQEAHTPGNYALLNKNIFTTDLEGRQSTKMPFRMFVSVSYEGDGSDQPDYKAAAKTVELLRQRKKDPDTPFFIATGFVRPHYPSVAPEQYFEPYPHEKIDLPHVPEDDLKDIPKAGISGSNSKNFGIDQYPENQQRMWSAYYATVQFMDEQVGKILDELDQLGLRESTMIVFASDHGYHLGEHTFWQKANLHEEVIRVPLIVSAPGMAANRSDSIVELVDIFPTVCELTGTAVPDSVEGKSLVPVMKDPKAVIHDGARSFVAKGESLRTPGFSYMRYKDGSEELYDMKADAAQYTNVAKDPKFGSVLEEHRKLLESKQSR